MLAIFSWVLNDRTITVRDKSLSPHSNFSVAWGDGTDDGVGVYPDVQSLDHTYDSDGIYTLRFTITQETQSNSVVYQIIIGNDQVLNIPILDRVNINLPYNITVEAMFAQLSLRKWQQYLSSISLNPEAVYNENSWGNLEKELLAKLVIYEAIMQAVSSYASTGIIGNTDADGNLVTASTSGPLKKIETGPSNVEYYDASSVIERLIQSSSINKDGTPQGFLAIIASDICYLARKVKIHLPMCKFNKIVRPFIIAKNPC